MGEQIGLIGSIIIGALILLAVLNLNSSMTSNSQEQNLDNIVKESTATLTNLLSYDFRNIGRGVANPQLAIQAFDSTTIRYYIDVNNDGAVDSVTYSLSDVASASDTPNPRDRILYRQLNVGPQTNVGTGIIDFSLTYFDNNGNQTATASDINCIGINLLVESTYGSLKGDSLHFASNYWQTKITPQSLIR